MCQGVTHSKLRCDEHEKLLNQFLRVLRVTTRCVAHSVPLLADLCPFNPIRHINPWTMTLSMYQEVDLRPCEGEERLLVFLQPETEELYVCESGGCWRSEQALD